ncbi:maleylacetate reductase (plasmid) [Deinococcus radiomollis]|uniref:maleylacetate reductase n=1 Tax=Deinococcus radiomollis TaxID=468916 RepID=UPI003892A9A8
MPSRVIFGASTRHQLAAELERLGLKRPLLLSTPQQVGMVANLGATLPQVAGYYGRATMHTPTHITEDALAQLQSLNADSLVALGGGSTTGLGKALALRSGLPQIVLPTTYAGSEMTPILGETQDGRKTTIRDLRVLPGTVIYDVELTLGLPVLISASSGMNALAHAAEALYAPDANPVTSLMALDAVRALARSLPRIVQNPSDLSARSDALYGAWLCGTVLGAVGMSLHHKLAHVLGGSFDLPHAESHAALLPHTVAYNAAGVPEVMRQLAGALGTDTAAAGRYALNGRLGNTLALRDLGMPESGIEEAADIAMEKPYPNPVPLERGRIRDLLACAWVGASPQE